MDYKIWHSIFTYKEGDCTFVKFENLLQLYINLHVLLKQPDHPSYPGTGKNCNCMSTKEKILEMASDPHKGEELTKQMITASKQHAGEVVIQVNDKQQIKLVRIAEVSK